MEIAGEFEPSIELIKERSRLTKKWLKHYSNWEGNLFKRDLVIRKKVMQLKSPLLVCN